MIDPVIQADRLTRYFGKKCIVRDLDVRIQPGKVTSLLGLNGAGKTTIIRIIMGLLRPTRGSCSVFGESSDSLSEDARRRIGYLVEGHFLYRSMCVADCAKFQSANYGSWDNRLFEQIVTHFGIRSSARIGTLSRGQRAGVALALVLAPDPDLLVLDDPALGLDPISRRALNETIIEFAGSGQKTVLLSTHLLDDVERVSDRVLVLVEGSLKVDAEMDEFSHRVSGYALEMDVVNPERLQAIPGLIEARPIGDRFQVTIADADQETTAALDRLGAKTIEETDPTFADSVLAYLARNRSKTSFLTQSTGAKR